MRTLAKIVSRVFDPVLLIPVTIILAMAVAVEEGIRWRFLGLLLFIDMVIPFIFFLVQIRNGQISNWDVRERRERLPLYFFTMLCHLAGVWLAFQVGKHDLGAILLVFWLLGIFFATITAFWKISVHGGVNAVLVTFINILLGWQYWPLFLVIPLVGWARIYDKHHTYWQYAAGASLGFGVTVMAMRLVGF